LTDRIGLSILRKVYDVTGGEDFNGALGGRVQVLLWEGRQSVLHDRQEHPDGAEEKLEECEEAAASGS